MSPPTQPVLEIHSGIVLKGQLSMVKDLVLTGKFEGELQTFGCLTVAPGGVVTGTIDAGALVLEPGNLVEARVKVSPPSQSSIKAYEEAQKKAAGGFWAGTWQRLKEFTLSRR
jgi:hypothetical protein